MKYWSSLLSISNSNFLWMADGLFKCFRKVIMFLNSTFIALATCCTTVEFLVFFLISNLDCVALASVNKNSPARVTSLGTVFIVLMLCGTQVPGSLFIMNLWMSPSHGGFIFFPFFLFFFLSWFFASKHNRVWIAVLGLSHCMVGNMALRSKFIVGNYKMY